MVEFLVTQSFLVNYWYMHGVRLCFINKVFYLKPMSIVSEVFVGGGKMLDLSHVSEF